MAPVVERRPSILITGGFGFIGLALARRILDKDKEARVMLLGNKPKDEWEVTTLAVQFGDRLTLEYAEIGDIGMQPRASFMQKYGAISQVYHLAAGKVTHADAGAGEDLFMANFFTDDDVFEAFSYKKGLKLLYASTCEVIGPLWERLRADENAEWPLNEHWRVGSVDFYDKSWMYALSKMVGEMRLLHGTRECRWTIARIASPYGPRMGNRTLIPVLMDAARRIDARRADVFVNDTRPYIYIDDLCDALILAMQSSHTDGRVVAMAGPEVTVGDVAAKIGEIVGAQHQFFDAKQREPFVPGHVRAVKTTMLSELGWRPWVDLEEGLRKTWEYYKRKFEAV